MLIENINVADPNILVSILNTKLRNDFISLTKLCKFYNIALPAVTEKLARAGYQYNSDINQIKRVLHL